MGPNLREKVLVSPGYDASFRLSDNCLYCLREVVNSCYGMAMVEAGIMNYANHAATFTKERRLLPPFDVGLVKRLPFMRKLLNALGGFKLSNVVIDGKQQEREEIYWRIVRPNHPEDVGPAHRDREFHERDGMHAGGQTVKCWIPLWCEPACGLCFPEIGVDVCKEGTIALFGADTLHCGAVNIGTAARISLEMTLALDDRA